MLFPFSLDIIEQALNDFVQIQK